MKNIKKKLLAIFILSMGTIASAQVKWHTIEEGIALQKQHPEKKILIDFYADWCGYCKKMDRVTWKDQEIANFVNKNYIPIKFNAEKQPAFVYMGVNYGLLMGGNGRQLNRFAYKAMKGRLIYPSFVLVDNQGQFVKTENGYRSPKKFMPFLKSGL